MGMGVGVGLSIYFSRINFYTNMYRKDHYFTTSYSDDSVTTTLGALLLYLKAKAENAEPIPFRSLCALYLINNTYFSL